MLYTNNTLTNFFFFIPISFSFYPLHLLSDPSLFYTPFSFSLSFLLVIRSSLTLSVWPLPSFVSFLPPLLMARPRPSLLLRCNLLLLHQQLRCGGRLRASVGAGRLHTHGGRHRYSRLVPLVGIGFATALLLPHCAASPPRFRHLPSSLPLLAASHCPRLPLLAVSRRPCSTCGSLLRTGMAKTGRSYGEPHFWASAPWNGLSQRVSRGFIVQAVCSSTLWQSFGWSRWRSTFRSPAKGGLEIVVILGSAYKTTSRYGVLFCAKHVTPKPR